MVVPARYNVVKRNPMLMQKEGRLGGFVAADRVKEVKAEIAGQNAVAVTWTPNVGAVRIWCQYKAPAVLSNGGEYLALMRDWLENEAAAGGKKFNIGVGATSELVDQIEKNMKNSGAFLGLPGKKLRAMRTKSSTGAVNRIMMETMNWGGCNNERPDEKEPTKAERIAMLLGKSQKTKVDPNSEAAKKKGLEFLSEWVLAATKTSGMSAPRVAIVSTAWANGHEEANGINQVRICVAPLHRQHRWEEGARRRCRLVVLVVCFSNKKDDFSPTFWTGDGDLAGGGSGLCSGQRSDALSGIWSDVSTRGQCGFPQRSRG